MARQAQGYTLVELVVVILIFSAVMTLISVSFARIVTSSAQIMKAAETDIGGLIGLEVLRCDLELAGFGLPWSLPSGTTYREGDNQLLVNGCQSGCSGAVPSLFNDAPDQPPRAYVVGDNVGFNGSDYLVLKGTALGMSMASRSWSYLSYSSSGAVVKPPRTEVELTPGNTPGSGDLVIMERSGATASGEATRELVTDGPGSGFWLVFNRSLLTGAFRPGSREESFQVYGVASADSTVSSLSYPFNRADYYLSLPDTAAASSNCAPGTAVLYKTVLNQNGSLTKYPILDCVLDLQVLFGLDTVGNGVVDYHASGDLTELLYTAAADLRNHVREIRVYLLAQQGRRDPGYRYPVTNPDAAIAVGDPGLDPALGSSWTQSRLASTVGPNWRNYHWKLYTIVVQPKNL